jgi:Peptidase A4 family
VLGGFVVPPAPNAKEADASFQHWKAAVSGPRAASAIPKLTATTLSNGHAQKPTLGDNGVTNGTSATSSNWSGTVALTPLPNGFRTEAIIGVFTVPTAQQAFGSCTGNWDYSSLWPGIDGWGSGDVLQAGVEADAYCASNGATKATYYSSWIEWYPYSETRVSSPSVKAGDLMFVEVWSTSPTQGYAYLHNYTTQETAEYSLTPPSGTTLTGNSAEWVVERPGVNGGLATLTNYLNSAWSNGVAWNYTASSPSYWYQGQTSRPNMHLITMLDDSGNGISAPTVENYNFLWFQNFGSSY